MSSGGGTRSRYYTSSIKLSHGPPSLGDKAKSDRKFVYLGSEGHKSGQIKNDVDGKISARRRF